LRYAANTRDWCNIADEIEIELCVKCGVNHIVGADSEQRIAIGERTHNELSTNIAASAWSVLNDELLT
jgi:hypothetical protein